MPSRTEPFGLAVVEAMLLGLPVVASAVGGIPEIVVDGVTGFLVPAEDVDALTAALRTLILDPDLRSRMGEEGRARAIAEFGLDRMVAQYEALYEALVGGWSRADAAAGESHTGAIE